MQARHHTRRRSESYPDSAGRSSGRRTRTNPTLRMRRITRLEPPPRRASSSPGSSLVLSRESRSEYRGAPSDAAARSPPGAVAGSGRAATAWRPCGAATHLNAIAFTASVILWTFRSASSVPCLPFAWLRNRWAAALSPHHAKAEAGASELRSPRPFDCSPRCPDKTHRTRARNTAPY
jgi:hypothetical protein